VQRDGFSEAGYKLASIKLLSRLYNHLRHRMPSVRAPFRFYALVGVYRNHGNLKLLIYNSYKAPAQVSASKLVHIVETVSC
jgi:hypothetical protein